MAKKLVAAEPWPTIPQPVLVKPAILLPSLLSRLSPSVMSDEDKLLILIRKIIPKTFAELRQNQIYRSRSDSYLGFREVLTEKVREDWVDCGMFSSISPHLAVLSSENETSQPLPPPFYQAQPVSNRSSRGKGKGKGFTPGKGKGKGKVQRSRSSSKDPSNRFSATITCHFCGKEGHYANKCWNKNPSLRPPNRSRSAGRKAFSK